MARTTTTPAVPDLWPDMGETVPLTELIDRGIRSRSQLSRDIASGRLPAYRLGQRLFVRKVDLLALVTPVRSA